MKTAELAIGGVYATADRYPVQGSKVEVLERAVPRGGGRRGTAVRVRVLVPRGYWTSEGKEMVIPPAAILHVWSAEDEQAAVADRELERRRAAVDSRVRTLGLGTAHRGKWSMGLDDAEKLLDLVDDAISAEVS